MVPVFRVFVSSPGDVAEERALAERVLRRLREELAGRVEVEGVVWEHEPLLATETFQSQLRRPSETDVMVSVLWARLGTRLPAGFTRADGTRYDSGTEFEFEDAVNGFRATGAPELLVYRKTAEPVVSMRDPAAAMERLEQKRKLDTFVDRWFHDRTDGSLVAAFHPFDEAARFEELLETHLRKLIARRFPDALRERATGGTWRHESPFRGLAAFDARHAPIFFGRTRETAEVMHALRVRAAEGRAFVLILGMSGSGKSSLARAGVLPLLTQPGVVPGVVEWRQAVLHPAESPGEPVASLVHACARATGETLTPTLAAARVAQLRDQSGAAADLLLGELAPGAALALVVDQLEELFTHAATHAGDAQVFVDVLAALAASGRAWTVGTLRSDYYAQCEALPGLVELKEGEGQYHLLPPTPAQIAEMVAGPARMAGLRLEEDATTGERLEQRLLDAAAASAGGLPLLEFTLEELHKRKGADNTLTLAAYDALGGVAGALATRAEEVWMALDVQTRATLPSVLRQLVDAGARGREWGTRRSAPLAGFTPAERELIAALVAARLLAAGSDDDGTAHVTISHESLLRHWPRVRDWVRDNGELLRTRARLESAASLWQEEGEPPERLLPEGKPLTDAMDLDMRFGRELTLELRRYVHLSRDMHASAGRRRRRRVAAVVGAVMTASTLFGAFSYVQWRTAERARDQATIQRTEALRASESLLTSSLQLRVPGNAVRDGQPAQLNDEQLAQLRDVLGRLAATGYRDTVELVIHPGQFRVVESPGRLAVRTDADACPDGACRTYPTAAEEGALVDQVSAVLHRDVVQQLDGVPVRVRAMPAAEPWDPYPPESAGATEWNAAARRNHRVIVLLAGG